MAPLQSNRWRWLITFILASMAASLIYQAAWEKRHSSNRNTLSSKKHHQQTQHSASSTLLTVRTKEGQELLQHNDMGYCPLTTVSTDVLSLSSSSSSSSTVSSFLRSSSSSSSSSTGSIVVRKASKDELESPLCKELATRYYEYDTIGLRKGYWSSKVCRFMMRHMKKQLTDNPHPSSHFTDSLALSICSYTIPYTQSIQYCGKMIAENDAPSERTVHPYTRQVSQTFFFWNKALAAYCDVSPVQMIDDSPDLPIDDYLPFVKTAKTFYIVTNQYTRFVRHILPLIDHPFVIVTGSADFSAPLLSWADGVLSSARELLDHPDLIAWFAQNMDMIHPKLIPIPIGIDYHTLAIPNITEHSWGVPTSALRQDALLQELRCTLPPFHERPVTAIVNFKASGRDIRSHVFNILQNRPGIRIVGGVKRAELWKMYGEFSFVVSPRGYGKDCHRTWEALTLGCAVIVSKDLHLQALYDDLPIIQIEDWDSITLENLLKWKEELSSSWHTFRFEKLRAAYWLDMVERAAKYETVVDIWKVHPHRNSPDTFSHGEFVYRY